MRQGPAVQRMRITYGVQGALMYASVLDMGRLWERLLRRARVPLVYSQGYNPHPRLQFAAPLPVGYGSDCELLDIWLTEPQDAAALQRSVAAQSPEGLEITQVAEVDLGAVAPQSTMQRASYRVHLRTAVGQVGVQAALSRLLSSATLPRQRLKKGRMADYDLRPLVEELSLVEHEEGHFTIDMQLRAGATGSGRAEEVVGALGIEVQDVAIRRIALLWDDAPAAPAADENEGE
jgi:radical SAM-linked protein